MADEARGRTMEKQKGPALMQKYELGRLLGTGTFAKVYHARNLKTGQSVAIKVIDKEKVLKVGLIDQIKREISVMRLVRHPNVVQLYEVMASKTKIYFAMEFVRGGELFNKVMKGKLKEDVARKYFQQLIEAVDFCHSRGVYHRDLKPENLLLDEHGSLKISDFGLSALWDSRRQDGLLHTTCGTPAYVAPEVINKKGYDGAKADIWSCGVILFVLMVGYLPFYDSNLMEMYKKIIKGDFRCPPWFPQEVRKLLSRILDPNPVTRVSIDKIMENSWFRRNFKRCKAPQRSHTDTNLVALDVQAAFTQSSSIPTTSSSGEMPRTSDSPQRRGLGFSRANSFNAFDLISLSQGFDLSGLFEDEGKRKLESRFTSTKPASVIASKFEEIARPEKFSVVKDDANGVVRLQGRKEGRKGQLEIDAEIYEVTPSFSVVEVKKAAGDTLEYQEFCDRDLRPSLKDVVWVWQGHDQQNKQHPLPA